LESVRISSIYLHAVAYLLKLLLQNCRINAVRNIHLYSPNKVAMYITLAQTWQDQVRTLSINSGKPNDVLSTKWSSWRPLCVVGTWASAKVLHHCYYREWREVPVVLRVSQFHVWSLILPKPTVVATVAISPAFVCLSVCLSTRCLQNDCRQDHQTWHSLNVQPWVLKKNSYFGSKRQRSGSRAQKQCRCGCLHSCECWFLLVCSCVRSRQFCLLSLLA